jgi:hypothetical protein
MRAKNKSQPAAPSRGRAPMEPSEAAGEVADWEGQSLRAKDRSLPCFPCRAVQCFKLGKGTCRKFNSDGRQALPYFPYLETLNCPAFPENGRFFIDNRCECFYNRIVKRGVFFCDPPSSIAGLLTNQRAIPFVFRLSSILLSLSFDTERRPSSRVYVRILPGKDLRDGIFSRMAIRRSS